MAASTGQGRYFTTFMVGLTTACAGIADLSTGSGKLALVVGAVILLVSLFGFMKIKPLEGETGAEGFPDSDEAGGRLCRRFWMAGDSVRPARHG